MPEDSERLFMALPVPPVASAAIERWREPLVAGITGVRWERAERMHLTLVFLGDTAVARVPRLVAAATGALAPIRLGPARLGAPGGFPTVDDPHTIWIGVEGHGGWIERVQAALARVVLPAGVAPDPRPFRAHVTVGKARRGAPRGERRAIGAAVTRLPPPPPIEWTADRVVLYESRIGDEGARYLEVATFQVA